ncbi:Hypothetical predicted protein [Paramuricea clavata]|uniref:Uncharacterized protein n=1 Tax=Paramuricea clavata TaxID=317549 RepID=A0A7D9KX58_PARCT|nr:Hypothetical predicted protein [Paramuricea clavata]
MAETNKQSSKSQVMIKAMKWTDQHDLELIKEILTERPFDNPKGSRRIGLVWERIVDNLNSRADIVFKLKDIRAVRDRYNLLAKKYKKKEREEINASGIGTDEPSELENAIEEAVVLFESQEEDREKEKTAKDEDRSQAEDVRLVALETARETAKRKASGNDSFRAKKTAIVKFLRDKANQDIEYRNKELEHKTKELEVRKQELAVRSKELEAQTQQNQNLLNTLLEFAKNR